MIYDKRYERYCEWFEMKYTSLFYFDSMEDAEN